MFGWKAAAGIAVSVALLWWVFRDEDLGQVVREIRGSNPWLLLLSAAAATSVFWIRAWRWRVILAPVRADTSFRSRFAAVNIGFMGNNVLPARVGEFARAYTLSRLEPVPLVASFSSLVIERMLDGLVIVGLLFLALALPDFPSIRPGGPVNYVGVARLFGIVIAIAFGALILLVLFPRPVVSALEAVVGRVLPRSFRRNVVDALEAFLAGAGILRNPILLFRSTSWTVVLWVVNSFAFWLGFLAFDIHLPFTAALFLQSCVALAVSVPSAPGFFGPFELATDFVLVELWGQPASKALGYALGFHIAGFIPVTLMGFFYAWRVGLSLRGVAGTEEVVEEAVERASGVDPEHLGS